jgi:LCP family protein required for cell wall assembly
MGKGTEKIAHGRHSAGQRLVFGINILIVIACLAGAVALLIGKHAAEQGQKVSLAPATQPTLPRPATTAAHSTSSFADETTPGSEPAPGSTEASPSTSLAELAIADPNAKNFLVVGADNNACIDPGSKYAPGIGHRTATLTDTIMVIRVDTSTKRAAVLSFPRDLWVRVDGSMRRINTAYRKNDPSILVATIRDEFGITIDHFIRVDFCAFMELVNAVGGVTVPLPYAVQDIAYTGLDVEAAGCHTFAGDEALAYVRSRHLLYKNKNGEWRNDPSSDFGRIARQQDFLRRTLDAARQDLLSVKVIEGLYSTYQHYLLFDDDLTISKIIDFAGVVQSVDSADIRNYQIAATGRMISGQAVLIAKDTPEMTAILDIFRGKSPLLATADTAAADTATTTAAATRPTTTSATAAVTSATEPQPNAPSSAIVPDPEATC